MEEERKPVSTEEKTEAEKSPEHEKLAVAIMNMSGNEKIKLALTGDAEARRLLLRDSNRVVQMSVLQNPRLTENEVISIANSRQTSDEMLRYIVSKREWYKSYAVRLALVKNPKTPFALALKMIGSLTSMDLKLLAKSKNVSPAVAQAAMRIIAKKR